LSRPIVVVGEIDHKRNGLWPGKDGALQVATELAGRGGRPVSWVLPDGAKDVRAWALAHAPDPTCLDEWHALGEALQTDLLANAREVSSDSPSGDRRSSDKIVFPPAVPLSQLEAEEESARWLWDGYLARKEVTLFSALWKAGKTTMLAHLLKAMELGGTFCGRKIEPCSVLYVAEERQGRWAARRDALDIGDHCFVVVRPFLAKPRPDDWLRFIDHLSECMAKRATDLIILDTLSHLWPVVKENDAAEVQTALMPLHQLTAKAGLCLAHHVRKGDGQEATASRGSGEITAFVDTILELRRFDAGNRQDRRRVLTGYGRWDDTPAELVIELRPDGSGYDAHGDKYQVAGQELRKVLWDFLQPDGEGKTVDEIREEWPEDVRPGRQRLFEELNSGFKASFYERAGEGVRGKPYRWFRGPNNPFPEPVS
jgi:hypothetical protein